MGTPEEKLALLARWGCWHTEAAYAGLMLLWGSRTCSVPEGNRPRETHNVTAQPLARHFLHGGKVSATPGNCLSPETATWKEA